MQTCITFDLKCSVVDGYTERTDLVTVSREDSVTAV